MTKKIAESLALAGIDESTRTTLRETWPLIREGVTYALQSAFAPAAAREVAERPSREQIDVARHGQARHWEALFAARFDEDYTESLRQLASIHAQVGLDPRWLISGYVTTLTELHSLIVATHCTSMMTWAARSRLERTIRAVDQAVLFDLQVCVAAYAEQAELMARERMQGAAQSFEPAAAALIETMLPSSPETRRAASDLFVASQRRTFHDTQPDGLPGYARGAAPVAAPVGLCVPA